MTITATGTRPLPRFKGTTPGSTTKTADALNAQTRLAALDQRLTAQETRLAALERLIEESKR